MTDSKPNQIVATAEQAEGHRKHAQKQQQQGDNTGKKRPQQQAKNVGGTSAFSKFDGNGPN